MMQRCASCVRQLAGAIAKCVCHSIHIETHTNIQLDLKKFISAVSGACIQRALTLPPTLLVVCRTAAKYSTSPPSRPLLCSNVRASTKLCDSIKKNDKYTPQTCSAIKQYIAMCSSI
jgi:hypothetical protein